jgi:hypothetical protein
MHVSVNIVVISGVIKHNPHQMLIPWGFFSGAEEDRTPDLLNAIQALSQLSYGPVKAYNLNLLNFNVNRCNSAEYSPKKANKMY